MGENDVIRISCVGLCRIQNEDGAYLLGLNRNRLRSGRRVLMCLGGSYKLESTQVLQQWQASLENDDEIECRFYVKAEHLPQVRSWFYERKQRELSPFRELYEELVEEYKVLDDLAKTDVDTTYLKTVEVDRETTRIEVMGQRTYYFLDVHDVVIKNPLISKQLFSIDDDNSHLYWVTEEQIHEKKLVDGSIIVDANILLP